MPDITRDNKSDRSRCKFMLNSSGKCRHYTDLAMCGATAVLSRIANWKYMDETSVVSDAGAIYFWVPEMTLDWWFWTCQWFLSSLPFLITLTNFHAWLSRLRYMEAHHPRNDVTRTGLVRTGRHWRHKPLNCVVGENKFRTRLALFMSRYAGAIMFRLPDELDRLYIIDKSKKNVLL